jgi:hypothetical protein
LGIGRDIGMFNGWEREWLYWYDQQGQRYPSPAELRIIMVEYNTLHLPSSEELPDSDDTPVDNELQDLIPALLRAILSIIWIDRQDWIYGLRYGHILRPG